MSMPQLEQDYVFLPQRLIADLQANPAAIGVYALIARLFLIYQEPIPLSAADMMRYDPSLSYGAARGALQRLVGLRWLADQSGHKNQYTPTWGVVKGTATLWRMDAPTLGRPAHVVTLRLDRRLLDVAIGKLIPHPTYPAQTKDRYLEQPILSLRDVGAYAQVLSGQALAATPALWRYGLIRNGQPQPLPDAAELIALASQRTPEGGGAAPTAYGLRKLGLEPAAPSAEAPATQALFFVDHALIPDPISHVIPDLIPAAVAIDSRSSTIERAITSEGPGSPRMQATPGTLRQISDSPPNPPTDWQRGGGDHLPKKEDQHEVARPETESACLLRSINAFPSSIEELANMPLELVGRAIAYAQSEPAIESIAGWVVEALRRHRDEGWPIPTPRTRHNRLASRDCSIDIETYTSGRYADLFRLGSDMSGLEDVYLDQHDDTIGPPTDDVVTRPSQVAGVYEGSFTDTSAMSDQVARVTDRSSSEVVSDELTRQVQAELRMRCGRQRGRVIEGLCVHVAGGKSLLVCATHADMEIVQRELIGALNGILPQFGAPLQLAFTTRAALEARQQYNRLTQRGETIPVDLDQKASLASDKS